MPDAAIIVLTTLPDLEAAQALARTLLAGRRGEIETAREVPVAIKTRALLYSRVEAAIFAAHPYELPEVVAVPITHGLALYLDWIATETQAP